MKVNARLPRSFSQWYSSLLTREKALVFTAVFGILLYLGSIATSLVLNTIKDQEAKIKRRQFELSEVNNLLKRYQQLSNRFKRVEDTFTQSQMTFEQVTAELDKLIRDSIGSSNYDLNKSRNPSDIGLEFEKQEFTIKVKSLSLDQIVNMLHKLENGDSPLFLGKLDITRSAVTGDFSASLEVYSIRKKSESEEPTSS